jgi:hypothetical protein
LRAQLAADRASALAAEKRRMLAELDQVAQVEDEVEVESEGGAGAGAGAAATVTTDTGEVQERNQARVNDDDGGADDHDEQGALARMTVQEERGEMDRVDEGPPE